MKKSQAIIVSLFALIFTLFFQSSFTLTNDPPTITKTFTIGGSGNLDVSTSGGKIKVIGTNGNEVVVKAFIKKQGKLLASDDPIIEEIYDGYDLDISKSGNTVKAHAKKISRSREWNRINIAFEVEVPRDMSTNLKTSGGGISVYDVDGTHDINTSGGGINLKGVTGDTEARTSGGGINVSGMDGNIDLNTSGGGISIEDSQGVIDAHTSGGGISVQNIKGEVDVSTSGGGISVKGTTESLRAVTSGGRIKVNIDGLSKNLYLKTSGGGIDATLPSGLGLDLDLDAQRVSVNLPSNFSGHVSKDRVDGQINGGGIPVQMYATSNVDVSFR